MKKLSFFAVHVLGEGGEAFGDSIVIDRKTKNTRGIAMIDGIGPNDLIHKWRKSIIFLRVGWLDLWTKFEQKKKKIFEDIEPGPSLGMELNPRKNFRNLI